MFESVWTHRLKHCLTAGVAVSCLFIVACVDLDQITQFAKASQDVGKTFSGIADEAKASCSRANSFINAQNPLTPLPCDFYAAGNPPVVKINDALFSYIAAVGKLAAADLSKEGGGFDSISADLKQADPKISAADQSKAAAVGALAKAITNLLTNGYRQHELSKIVAESNEAVQKVTEFLSQYAADKYRQSMADEWRYENSYCTGVLPATAEPIASDLLKRKCEADKSRIDLQLKAIDAYKSALATVAATHQKLYDERGHWGASQLFKDISPGTASLGSAAVSVHKAF
ncbi:MAG: hypothetical protein ABSH56_10590 [Bryobacteraceae bacterium]